MARGLGAVPRLGGLFADPHFGHRGLVQYATDPELGDVPHIRTPVKIDGSIRVRAVAPKLGQHNAEIFDRMRLSEQDIETLQAQRVD